MNCEVRIIFLESSIPNIHVPGVSTVWHAIFNYSFYIIHGVLKLTICRPRATSRVGSYTKYSN